MRAAVFKQPHQPVVVGRYEIVKLLGSGAMGIVYEAFDPRRGEAVALKTLRAANTRALSLFKREFRALSRLTHPNLVALYEMGRDHDQYFFTMELVRGSTLLKYLWGAEDPPLAGISPVTDFGRLRAVFAQLVDGVAAIHQAHKLHRDIKPTNVMVTAQGRVVLMDFGFVGEETVGTLDSTAGNLVVGTPAYMAPEQAQGGARTAASDWYSVGATLYTALVGRTPWSDLSLAAMMERKAQAAPPPPRDLVSGVPEDLDAICLRLLAPDPKDRPSADELLTFFHNDRGHSRRLQAALPSPAATHVGARSFVGRAREVHALTVALDAALAAGASVPGLIFVRGRAGVGKSALIRHVTDALRQRAVLLRARCYERDTVPYKALDSLVDALARYLRQHRTDELALPPDLDALVALFPALAQVPALAAALPPPEDAPAPRRRDHGAALRPDAPAARALRQLLVDLGKLRPLVLWLDDLQWGDPASVRALADLLRPPGPPRAALVASFRSEDPEIPALRELDLLRKMARESGYPALSLELAPLPPEEALALARLLLGPDTPPARVSRLAAEAEGSPQLLHELARFVAHGADSSPEVSLEELLEVRISRLAEHQRRLLEVLAIARGPLSVALALAAAGRERTGPADLQQLLGLGLVRSVAAAAGDAFTLHHERTRDAVLARLDGPELRDLHARLAAALSSEPDADPVALVDHLRAAGDAARAQALALSAARDAAAADDFPRAAALLFAARDLSPAGAAPALSRELGEALARAGRSREAAEAYLAGRTGSDAVGDLALTGAAAAHLLLSGHVSRGRALLQQALATAGVAADEGSVRGRLAALWRRGQRIMRGLDFIPRREADVDRLELVRVDLCFAAALSALLSDPAAAADAQARHLLLALRVGEPRRVARALALEACLLAPFGPAVAGRMAPLLSSARDLARRSGAPAISDLTDLVALLAAIAAGESTTALELAAPLIRAGTAHAVEVPGLAGLARLCELRALLNLGRYATLRERLPALIAAAEANDDRSALVAYRSVASWLALLDGDLARARAEADACAATWPEAQDRCYHLQHLQILTAQAQALVAAGDPPAAWALVDAAGPAIARSGLIQILPLRVQATELQGRIALAALARGGAATSLGRAVERAAGTLQQDGARGHAALLRGGLAALAGAVSGAHNHLKTAADCFAAADLPAHAAAARLRLARLQGKPDDEPRAALLALGVPRPDNLVTLLAPGF